MSVHQKGDKWFVKFVTAGQLVRKFGFTTEEQGEAWELQARAALKLGKELPPIEGKAVRSVGGRDAGTLENVLRSATMLHWNQLRGGGGKQIVNAGIFVAWAGPKLSVREAFTPQKMREFTKHLLEERRCATVTVNKYMSAISVLMRHADAPKIDLPWYKPTFDRARKRYFTPEDEAAVADLLTRWGRERERDFFLFENDTGLRPWTEARKATWERCRKDRIVDIVGKSGKLRDVPLTPRAAAILARQPRGGKGPWCDLHPKAMSDLWLRVIGAIPSLDGEGPNKTVWYTCRHTFASRLVQAGVGYGHIAKLMDNSVAMIEKVYGHLDPHHLKGALVSLEKYARSDGVDSVAA